MRTISVLCFTGLVSQEVPDGLWDTEMLRTKCTWLQDPQSLLDWSYQDKVLQTLWTDFNRKELNKRGFGLIFI